MSYWWAYWSNKMCVWNGGGQSCLSPYTLRF